MSLRRVDDAVGVGRRVQRDAAGQRAAEDLAGDGQAVALVLAEGQQRADAVR
jgi:hypothetical protein